MRAEAAPGRFDDDIDVGTAAVKNHLTTLLVMFSAAVPLPVVMTVIT
jgi:hypothetical protein